MIHHERLRPPPDDYPADEWHVIEKAFHPESVSYTHLTLPTIYSV